MTTPLSPLSPVSEEDLAARMAAHEEYLLHSLDEGASTNSAEGVDSERTDRISRSKAILRLLDRVWRRDTSSDSKAPVTQESQDNDRVNAERVTNALSGQIGRFDLVRELGRGGFGIVFLAVDPVLGRTVALKVPRPEVLVTPELRDRFLREAQAAAGLNHPNLVQVYEAGEIGPICYIVSAYCPGTTLHNWLAERKGPVEPRLAANLVAMIAGAVQHAHDRGILHRDLKPANILLESLPPAESAGRENVYSELRFVPKLTDFGLAKLLERETSDNATPMSAIIGTPAYMSPEQAAGGASELSPASDVYSLGAVLYELLTGKAPFAGSNDRSVIAQLLTEEVRPPRHLCRAVPPDLEAICLKCLEKQPARRYESAAALNQDLQRFLDGVPTQARPLGPGGRLLKWARRKPATAVLAALCMASLCGALLAYNLSEQKFQSAVNQAEQERTAVQKLAAAAAQRESEFRRRYYVAGLKLSYAAYKSTDVHQAVQFLEQQRSVDGQEEVRGFVWHYLWRLCHGDPMVLAEQELSANFVAYSFDGHIIGAAGSDGVITLWDMPGHQLRTKLSGHTGRVNAIAFSPDGETLASCGADHTVRLWSLSSGKERSTLIADGPETLALAFTRDGRSLATAGKNSNIELWDTATWKKRGELAGRVTTAGAMSWSADGHFLASGADHAVKVWEVEKPSRAHYEFALDAPVTCLAYSNDGRTLVSAALSPVVKLWDMTTGKSLFDLTGLNSSEINFAQFSSDDSQLATASVSGVLRVWNLKTKTQTRFIQGHAGGALCLSLSPLDGSLVTTGIEGKEGDAGAIKLWSFSTRRDTTSLEVPVPRIETMSFCARGRSLVCGDIHGALHWYDVPAGTLRRMNHEHSSRIVKLTGSADGSYLASASDDGSVRIWDPATGAVRSVLTGHIGGALSVSFSADSQLLASGAADGKVRIWHSGTGQLVQELQKYPERIHALAFAPDGRRLAVGHGRVLSVWNLDDENDPPRELAGSDATIEMIGWSLDKHAIAVVDVLGRAYEWNESSEAARPLLTKRPADERALIFGNRGGGIITGDSNGNFTFWSFVSEQVVITLSGHGGPVTNAAFSLDGRTVATAGTDQQGRNQIFLWLSGTDPH